MKRILLDTHVYIWFINGSNDLSLESKTSITSAIHANSAFIADISIWEICMLHKKQRIILDMPCQEWLDKSLELTRIQVQPLTIAIANESCNLPGDFHGDPADQLITATARVEHLTLVTRDKQILAYSQDNYISALKA